MWQKIYEFGKQLLTLKSQVEKNTQDLKELRQDLKNLTAAVQKLVYVVNRNSENDSHEREKLILRLENALLKVERRFLLGGRNDPDEE
jgi:hypothetical protein